MCVFLFFVYIFFWGGGGGVCGVVCNPLLAVTFVIHTLASFDFRWIEHKHRWSWKFSRDFHEAISKFCHPFIGDGAISCIIFFWSSWAAAGMHSFKHITRAHRGFTLLYGQSSVELRTWDMWIPTFYMMNAMISNAWEMNFLLLDNWHIMPLLSRFFWWNWETWK